MLSIERYTDRARKVLALTNQEAQRLNHEYQAPEHIFLALVGEGSGVAANVLKNHEVDLKVARNEVEKLVKHGPKMVTMGKLPYTPLANKVLENAIVEARNLNHNYAGTEHILLALLQIKESVVAQVMANLGLKQDKIYEEIIHLLGEGEPTYEDDAPLAKLNVKAYRRARRKGKLFQPVESLPPESDDIPNEASLVFYVDSGEAPPKVISDVLVALNDLNIAAGGLGLVFRTDGHEIHTVMGVQE